MSDKNKTNPQISEFELITIQKKTCLYQNYIELFKKIHKYVKKKIGEIIITFLLSEVKIIIIY